MYNASNVLEVLANDILENSNRGIPSYTKRDFMNSLIIFQDVLMRYIWENQEFDNMEIEDRFDMVYTCGGDLRKLIHTYTNLDVYKVEEFI